MMSRLERINALTDEAREQLVAKLKPASFSQRRLWFLDALSPGTSAYNIFRGFRIYGLIQKGLFEAVFEKLLERHSILRTIFIYHRSDVYQAVVKPFKVEIPLIDLSDLCVELQLREAQNLGKMERKLSFNLADGPLFRAKLLRTAPEEHILLFSIHHIAADGWSLGILVREVAVFLDAFIQGKEISLEPLPMQYGEFAAWQRGSCAGPAGKTQLDFWKKHLKGAPRLDLPIKKPSTSSRLHFGKTQALFFSGIVARSIRALAVREKCTVFIILLAAFKALLYRISGQNDIVIGTSILGRDKTELEGLIGCFVNQLVLRTDLGGNPTFIEVFHRVRKTMLDATQNSDVPFDQLVEQMRIPRDAGENPFYGISFSFQPRRAAKLILSSSLQIEPFEVELETSRFDLSMELTEVDAGFSGFIEYDTELFDADSIQALASSYEKVLEIIAENPLFRLNEVSIIARSDELHLLHGLNQTERRYYREIDVHEWLQESESIFGQQKSVKKSDITPGKSSLECLHATPFHRLFEEQVKRQPLKTAVEFRGEEFSYQRINRAANKVARGLIEKGAVADGRVGMCVRRSPEMVIVLIGILKAGAAFVPLDPNNPKERLAQILNNAGACVVVASRDVVELFDSEAERVIVIEELEIDREEATEDVSIGVNPEQLAYVIYTSGSTGKPKGVMISHRSLTNYLIFAAERYLEGEGSGSVVHTSIGFDLTLTGLLTPLIVGQKIILTEEGNSAEVLAVEIRRRRELTLVKLTPAHLEALRNLVPAEELAGRVRTFVVGGEALPVKTVEYWKEWAAETSLINEYGPTETVVGCCIYDTGQLTGGSRSVPIGRPISNTTLYVTNSDLQLLPSGFAGELWIGGEGLARGYLNDPASTAAAFVPNPFSTRPGERIYRSGDLCRLNADSYFEFLGRKDGQVKIRGFRIEIAEIEEVMKSIAEVRDAIVKLVEKKGVYSKLAAYVVLQNASAPVGEIRDKLREKLPVEMVPDVILVLKEFPLTINGKVDRDALPNPKEYQTSCDNESARSDYELAILAIWNEVLGRKKIGIKENFFKIGGHSLLATQVVSRIRQRIGVELSLKTLFQSPTIEALARIAEELKASTPSRIELGKRNKFIPLSFAQERLWFINQLNPSSSAYHIAAATQVDGQINPEILEKAINEVHRRHESLRTVFEVNEGRPFQKIHPPSKFILPIIDLSGLPEAKVELEVTRLGREESKRSFNLSKGPLARCCFIFVNPERSFLLYTLHHIIADGWSMGILNKEIVAAYRAFASNQMLELPELSIQYADYAIWQRDPIRMENYTELLSYWSRTLEGAVSLRLPNDFAKTEKRQRSCGYENLLIDHESCAKIREVSDQAGSTLHMAMFTLFADLLVRYTGKSDITLGCAVAGRDHIDLEPLIGFFVNSLPIRIKTESRLSFIELLNRVKTAMLGALQHREVPFKMLVEAVGLHDRSDADDVPLISTMFAYQNMERSVPGLDGIQWTPLSFENIHAKFDLELHVWDSDGVIIGYFIYNEAVFRRSSIALMRDRFVRLAQQAAIRPDAPLSSIRLEREVRALPPIQIRARP